LQSQKHFEILRGERRTRRRRGGGGRQAQGERESARERERARELASDGDGDGEEEGAKQGFLAPRLAAAKPSAKLGTKPLAKLTNIS
jgi:hypothetical protein